MSVRSARNPGGTFKNEDVGGMGSWLPCYGDLRTVIRFESTNQNYSFHRVMGYIMAHQVGWFSLTIPGWKWGQTSPGFCYKDSKTLYKALTQFGGGQVRGPFNLSKHMLRACAIDFGMGWVNHLPLGRVFIQTIAITIVSRPPHLIHFLADMCRSTCFVGSVVGEAQILGPELIQETTEKIIQIKQRMQAARDRQKCYAI
ncbi:hypothetical protein Tco_0727828 [Tanacetum coccineum]|uniref:Uncharacterized protein n=1 Tax=Tanacetum coccineum TaxID=301880 RepID=A0ABQ4YLX8_9ASTR